MGIKLKKPELYYQLKHEWLELDLSCKSILIIGFILLLQFIYAVLICQFETVAAIDTIFRTSLSSILGYILGMNLIHEPKKSTIKNTNQQFDETTGEKDPVLKNDPPTFKATNIRVVYATIVCMMCIVTLIIATCTNHTTNQNGLNQIGHLISTTIGFLISNSSRTH